MSVLKIIVCMFLTAGVSIRFVAQVADYNGSVHDAVELLLASLEIAALAYLFTLL